MNEEQKLMRNGVEVNLKNPGTKASANRTVDPAAKSVYDEFYAPKRSHRRNRALLEK